MNYVAHRGYSRRFAENTLPAFQAVIDHPSNGHSLIGIELDIHLTSDGHIPVMHETSIPDDNGVPIPVAQMSLAELRLRHKQHHKGTTPPVPSIEQVFELVNHRTELCFEIKIGSYDLERFTRLFIEALEKYSPRDDVIVSSFSYDILEFVRPFCKPFNLRYGFIFNSPEALHAVPHDIRKRFDLLHPWYRLLFDAPELFRSDTRPIRCWTVNDPAVVAAIAGMKLPVEAVMTDDISLTETPADTGA